MLWLYTALLLLWFFGRNFFGEGMIFILGMNYLGIWLFAPLFVFIPWVFLKQDRRGMIPMLFSAYFFVGLYGSFFIPKLNSTADSATSFTVMTFNLQYTNTDFIGINQSITPLTPEILAMQEVTSLHYEILNQTLANQYPHRAYYAPAGLAVFSQYPILQQEIYASDPWSIQSIILGVQGRTIHLINGHLAKPGILLFIETWDLDKVRDLATIRRAQIDQIIKLILETGRPTVIACDCNMTNLNEAYTQITSHLQDAYKARGWGMGHTFLIPRGFEIHSRYNLPIQRIDYLFNSPELGVTQIEVIRKDSGSDHRAVWAQLEFQK